MADELPNVTVVDVKMPFWSMVVFMVKWAFAAIPAMIIIFLVLALGLAIIGPLYKGFTSSPASFQGAQPSNYDRSKMKVTSQSAWCLSNPSDPNSLVELLPYGQVVSVLSREGNWYVIKVGSREVWINESHLRSLR